MKSDKNGNENVISLKNIEWRECLNCKRKDLQIELNGLKNERSITIGTLRKDFNFAYLTLITSTTADSLYNVYSI